ncbi:MOSC domain-containing protein [Paenibacillus albidus]|uniref:MOSC domain-containing protein n=1 Tax=Paenibacillus albidus TaxID=2041023 RepID=UPI001BE7A354|nr:MOSC domain-containing protein [Paenibacillus albidus]MBT2293364.1 MOSC domain-containing protein [Paenibacillus albidus]
MQSGVIKSLNVGMPKQVPYLKKEIMTGIHKAPVHGPLYLSRIQLDGDGQADLVHHGGVDKAVCVYPYEHYPYWEREMGRELSFGAFGENLTITGFTEEEVCIGDIFSIGGATVQISQPRQPCFKLSVKYGLPELPLRVQETGYTGYYFRVLEEGQVDPQDELILRERHSAGRTVAYANRIMHQDKDNRSGIEALLAVDALSASWQATLRKRLGGDETSMAARLNGEQ